MGSVFAECKREEVNNPSVVKVVVEKSGYALYFSRHAIPFARNDRVAPVWKHIGIYAYTKTALEGFSQWEQTPCEIAESLEQLRFLENGVRIMMSKGQGSELAVDTPGQAESVRQILAARMD